MKNLFALAFVAFSLVLFSCGSKETTATADSTTTATTVAAGDSVKKDTTTTAPVAATGDSSKPAEVKKEEVKK